MKIYVVTEGNYSDYHIEGVYSTKEIAEKAVILLTGRWSHPKIEEWEIDTVMPINPDRLPWAIQMETDGSIVSSEREPMRDYTVERWVPYGDNKTVHFIVFAETQHEAEKIANERRMQLLASNEWTLDWNEWRQRK